MPPVCAKAGTRLGCRHTQLEEGSKTLPGRRCQFTASARRQGSHRAQARHGTAAACSAALTCSDAGAAGVPRLLGPRECRPWVRRQSVPESPHSRALVCPMCQSGTWGVGGNAQGLLCPQRGWDWGWQTGLRASAAWHRAISQHVPAWDTVVSPLLLQKRSFLSPKDTNVPMSPHPPHTPLAPASPSALGRAEGGCAQSQASPAPRQPRIAPQPGPALPCPGTPCPDPRVQHRDGPLSPQPRKPTLAAMPRRPPSTTR